MNCDKAKDNLIDLVYGELGEADAASLKSHVAACPACRDELARLRIARTALAAHRSEEPPADLRTELLAPVLRRPIRLGRWLTAAMAAAAAIVAAVLFLEPGITPVARGMGRPVEIKRVGVSLTILSQPEGWGETFNPVQQQELQFIQLNVQGRWGLPRWLGLALVRDQRLIRNLPKGETSVSFTNVPAAVQPDSVRLRSLDDPDGLAILEQNYQYDLASASAVLKRYVDKPITVALKGGQAVRGDLLSFDEETLVVRPTGEGPRTVIRREVDSIRFDKLPDGLLSRPTLVWQLRNRAAAEQQFEVAYLTGGLAWRADYVLKLHPAAEAEAVREGVVTDTADLVGYATVSNLSGVTYEDAQLKLLAGDVNLIRPPMPERQRANRALDALANAGAGGEQFQEKSFFEYHLYTLGRATTIRDAETKQIELVSGSGLRMKRAYVYDPDENRTAARTVSEMKNSEENGLGKPLPKGVVRLYAPDDEGEQAYVSQTTIDHTPKDEKLRLPWGYAFNIVCGCKETNLVRRGADYGISREYSLRNHKPHDVTITIVARVPTTTYRASCTRAGKAYPWHVREVGVIEIEVSVRANTAEKIILDFRYDNRSGGGLKSPHDGKKDET